MTTRAKAGEAEQQGAALLRRHGGEHCSTGLPMPDDRVNIIVSTASMHHWAAAGAVVTSLGRVLRPDGRICGPA